MLRSNVDYKYVDYKPYISAFQMSPKSNSVSATFLDDLAFLRNRYVAMLEGAENQANHAKEQLVHLNALLIDQMLTPGLALADLGTAEFSSPSLPPAAVEIPAFTPTPLDLSSISRAPKATAKTKVKAPVVTKGRKAPGQMSKSSTRDTVLPLLPPYGGLTKIQAVTKVMEERVGQEVHLDDVILVLHGQLDKITLRQERGRMRNLMWRGADRKLWDKIRGKDSYYTLKTSLLSAASKSAAKATPARGKAKAAPVAAAKAVKSAKVTKTTAKAAKATTTKTKVAAKPAKAKTTRASTKAAAAPARAAKKETPVRGVIKKAGKGGSKSIVAPSIDTGSSLMGSVEQVLRKNKGKSMTAEEIATAIFGNLDRTMLTQVKKQISDRLAKGVKYKRWQRVPNKIGSYIYS
jgi:hypothetical protein